MDLTTSNYYSWDCLNFGWTDIASQETCIWFTFSYLFIHFYFMLFIYLLIYLFFIFFFFFLGGGGGGGCDKLVVGFTHMLRPNQSKTSAGIIGGTVIEIIWNKHIAWTEWFGHVRHRFCCSIFIELHWSVNLSHKCCSDICDCCNSWWKYKLIFIEQFDRGKVIHNAKSSLG